LRGAGGLVGLTTGGDDFCGSGGVGMAVGGGLYAVGGYETGRRVFGLICLGWGGAQRTNLKGAELWGFADYREAISENIGSRGAPVVG